MSFGFSTGDFVLFTQFAAKVIKGLRDEGGSKAGFQLGERQCRGFLSVMDELKSLDLSGVAAPSRDRIAKYSTSVQDLVKQFRQTIARYVKSMGEHSKRGALSSAPRRI